VGVGDPWGGVWWSGWVPGLEALSREELLAVVAAQAETIEGLTARLDDLEAENAELRRRVGQDSSNSSRPPSVDAPWEKKPARKRSSRGRSVRKPGKQSGGSSTSRSLVDGPDEVVVIASDRCPGCAVSLAGAVETGRERRQVVDVVPVVVAEYQRVSRLCPYCGKVTTPGWDAVSAGDRRRDVMAGPGSPVRIGPETLARAALLTCGHYLPVGRARDLLVTLTGMEVSTGLLAGVRGRAARKLEGQFPGARGGLAGHRAGAACR
jgi:transposase